MLGDGNITNRDHEYRKGSKYQITLNNKSKLKTKEFVINILERENIRYHISNDCEICWTYFSNNIEKIGITRDMIYDANKEKRFLPELLHLPKNKISMIMKGLLESDGCLTDTGIYFTNTSKNLVQSMRYLCLRLGLLTTCSVVNKVGQTMNKNPKGKDIISRKVVYNLRLPRVKILKENDIFTSFDEKPFRTYIEWNNILWCRVKSINKLNYSGKVYDFNMEDNHNYLTDMGLVHNSGKRNGSVACYLEPWHADIFQFVELRKGTGDEKLRARDLFLGLWICDLFMKRVEDDADWSLMCPNECPGLVENYGEAFEKLYLQYEKEGRIRKTVKAHDLWKHILENQIETGMPYIAYKDSVNKKNMQAQLGTIRNSNLCVSPKTQILTKNGYTEIHTLVDQEVELWNGEEWSKSLVRKTGENQKLIRVHLSNGESLECTEYHKFPIIKGSLNKYELVEAKYLIKNMKLAKYNLPILEGDKTEDLKYPYTEGFFTGDGNDMKGDINPIINLYGEKKKTFTIYSSKRKFSCHV
jgi:intein/homing endonuclease